MKKRALAIVLWFFAGWYVGAFGAFVLGVSPALAPIVATLVAAIVAKDPLHAIWTPDRG